MGSWFGAKTALKLDSKHLKEVFLGISILTLINLLRNIMGI
ncbi:hypothetical protein P8X35_08560 [Pyrococcus kukulkanii]